MQPIYDTKLCISTKLIVSHTNFMSLVLSRNELFETYPMPFVCNSLHDLFSSLSAHIVREIVVFTLQLCSTATIFCHQLAIETNTSPSRRPLFHLNVNSKSDNSTQPKSRIRIGSRTRLHK